MRPKSGGSGRAARSFTSKHLLEALSCQCQESRNSLAVFRLAYSVLAIMSLYTTRKILRGLGRGNPPMNGDELPPAERPTASVNSPKGRGKAPAGDRLVGRK
jgi:hypothetical protein